jgi:hypothetical protein
MPGYHGIRAAFLNPIFQPHFEFVDWNPDSVPPPDQCLIMANIFYDADYLIRLRQQGYKTVIDNLPEMPITTDHYQLINPNWFWYRESLLCRYHGYNQRTPVSDPQQLAFMAINQTNSYRDRLVQRLEPWLHQFVWSYRDQKLPGDLDPEDPQWQRYLNPDWYDQTYFSFVVETALHGQNFITEKSFKPMAYHHPFLIWGQAGTLTALQRMGFETYSNLFDESYDTMPTPEQRLTCLIENLQQFRPAPYDLETQRRAQHNHDHFFDQDLVCRRLRNEILEPLLHYAHST